MLRVPLHANNAGLLTDILKETDSGLFTPFIGPGVSTPSARTRNGLDDWRGVKTRLRKLLEGSIGVDGQELEVSRRLYIESLARARGIALDDEDPVDSPSEIDQLLLPLQLALGKLGDDLIGQFASAMTNSRTAVVNVLTYAVPFTGTTEMAAEVMAAVDAARVLEVASQPREESRRGPATEADDHPMDVLRDHLNPDAIHCGLQWLALRLIGLEDLLKLGKSFERHEIIERAVRAVHPPQASGTLSLDELAWLSDLLWHTLRYDVRSYPTPSELAFRISLEVADQLGPRHSGLAEAAEAWNTDEEHVGLIQKWFRYWREARDVVGFYDSLAAVLTLQYRKVEKLEDQASQALAQPREGPVASYIGGLLSVNKPPTCASLALTTNYDRSLEHSLDRLRVTHHVIFPVGDGSVWLMKTRCWDDPAKPIDIWGRLGYNEKSDSSEGSSDLEVPPLKVWSWQTSLGAEKYETKELEGPVIVKIHGSPEDQPSPREVPPNYSARPFLVLSESAYLRTASGRTAKAGSSPSPARLPGWVEGQLSLPGRKIWFLGYSISDWNVRLTMHREISRIGSSEEFKGSLVDMPVDDWLLALVRNLKVQYCEGDLAEFGALLEADRGVKALIPTQGD